MAAHLEQTWRDNCRARRKHFIDTTGNEQNDANNKRSDRLWVRPLRHHIISPHRNTTEVTLTCCLTKVKADKQADDACDETNECDNIKFGKLVPDRAFFTGVEIEESEENSCCNTADGPGDDC